MSASVWPTPYPAERAGVATRKAATAAIEAHLSVLQGEPLRLSLSRALKAAERLGGNERRFAAFAARELSRHMRLLDYAAKLLGHPPGKLGLREDLALARYALWRRLFCGEGWARVQREVGLPGPVRPRTVHDALLRELVETPLPDAAPPADPVERLALRHSFPNWLAERLAQRHAEPELDALLAALNEDPGLFLRVRPPGSRDQVLAILRAEDVEVEPVDLTRDGLRTVGHGHKVFDAAVMRKGRLQVQDVGSQLIVEACLGPGGAAPVGQTAVDVCAGAGGKTLALADWVGPTGRVLAGDTSRRRLGEARERVRAWGLKQVSFPQPLPLDAADLLLIDAPCSGTGTLARDPDQKWKLTPKAVEGFQATQGGLLDEAAARARAGALVVYATCSVLREENEAVVEAFLARHPGWRVEPVGEVLGPERAARVCDGPFLRAVPPRTPGGGFFAARLRRP